MGGFLKVMVGYSKIVEGSLKVAERLFRSFLSKRLGTQNLIAKKEFLNIKIKRCENVLSKRLGTKKIDCKKELLNVKIKRSRNVNKTFIQRYHNVFLLAGYFQHVIRCHLHHDVLCLTNANINTLLAYFDGI